MRRDVEMGALPDPCNTSSRHPAIIVLPVVASHEATTSVSRLYFWYVLTRVDRSGTVGDGVRCEKRRKL